MDKIWEFHDFNFSKMIRNIAPRLALTSRSLVFGVGLGWVQLGAAEFVICDATAALESAPRTYDYRIANGTTDVDGSDVASTNPGLRVGLAKSYSPRGSSIGPIIGGELVLRRLDVGGGSVDTRAGFEVNPGVGWSPNDHWQFLLLGVGGIGLEHFSRAAADGYDSATAKGHWTTLGLRGRVQFALKRRWWIGAEVSWTDSPGIMSGDGLDLVVRPRGLGFGLTMQYRIDMTPTRLE